MKCKLPVVLIFREYNRVLSKPFSGFGGPKFCIHEAIFRKVVFFCPRLLKT